MTVEALSYWLVTIDQSETVTEEPTSKEEAYAAKRAHVAWLRQQGYEFEGSTGLWVQYNDQGWDTWQEVYVEDSFGNHWFVGDEPEVKAQPPISRIEEILTRNPGYSLVLTRNANGEHVTELLRLNTADLVVVATGTEDTLDDALANLEDNERDWQKPPVVLDAARLAENANRAAAADAALEARRLFYAEERIDDPVEHLLADLMHYCAAHDLDFDQELERARYHARRESTPEEIKTND